MTVTRKLLVPLLIFLAVVLIAIQTINAVREFATANENEEKNAALQIQSFHNQIAALQSFATALAIETANNPEVQAAFAAKDRERLTELTLPAYLMLDETFDIPQHQFHLPPATSFLRLHQLDKFGDDLSSFRNTVLAANEKQQPISGPEIGRSGLGVRGVVPVEYENEHIGSVEFGLNVERSLLDQLKNRVGGEWQILLRQDPSKIAIFEGAVSGIEGPTPDLILQTSTFETPIFASPDVYEKVLNGEDVFTNNVSDGDQVWSIHSAPLRDFSGEVIGVVEVANDRTAVINSQINRTLLLFGTLIMTLLVIGVGVAYITRRTLRPINELTAAAEAIAGGDLERQVPITSKDEIGTLATAFNSMTVQLRNSISNLEQRVANRTRDLNLAQEMGRVVSEILDGDQLLSDSVQIIQSDFNLYLAQIYLVDEETNTLVLKAANGQAADRLLQQGHFLDINRSSINGTAALDKEPVIVSDTYENLIHRPNPLLPATRSEMAIPIIASNKVLGVLDLQSIEPHAFSEENLPAFVIMTRHLGVALENAALFNERETSAQALEEALKNVESQAERFRVLNQLGAALTTAKNLDEVYEIVSSQILSIIKGNRAGLSLLSPDKTTFQMTVLTGAEKGFQSGDTMPAEDTAIYAAIKQNHIIRLPEDAPLSTYKDASRMAQQGMQSALIAPLVVSGEAIGTMNIGSNRPFTFSNTDENFIQQIATLLASTIDSLRLLERVQRLATIVENHPDVIGVVSLDGHTIYVNPSGLAMMGLPADHDVTDMDATDFHLEEDVLALQQEGILAAQEFGSWTSEASLRKADGGILPVEETVAINFDANNNPIDYSVTMRDISGRKQAEQAQQRLNTQLEERLLQVNALQRAMTHEGWAAFLTSPNRLVQGYSFNDEQIKLISKIDLERKNVPQPTEETAVPDALAIPVKIRGEQVGVIGVRNPNGEPITDEQTSVIRAMTMQVAEALDRARLFEEMELAREQMNALYTGSGQVVRAHTIEEVLNALVNATALKRLDRVNFMFFDKPRTDEKPAMMTVMAVWEKDGGPSLQPVGTQYLTNQLPGGGRITKDKPVILSNIAADDHIDADVKTRVEQLNIHSIIFFPLVVGGQWFGLLSAQSFTPITLSEGDIRQITSLVDQAASVSQTQQLFTQARERAHREQLLREVTARVYAAPDAESILKTAVKEVNRILGVDSFIYLDSPGTPKKNATTPENGRSPAKENNAEQKG